MVSLKEMAKDSKHLKTSKATKQPSKKPAKPEFKSSELIQESDDEGLSESESDSDDESIDLKPANGISGTDGKSSTPEKTSSESESESDQETTSSEEDEGDEDSTSTAKKVPILSASRKNPAPESFIKSATTQKPTPYKAPSGFAIEAPGDDIAVSDILSNRNLDGKQVWYFTAPASVDISALEKVSLRDIKEGNSVLKLKDDEYQFVVETASDQTFTNIMVPNAQSKGYRIASKPIDQILHLQQKVNLPGINGSDIVAASLIKKAPRPQPKGLRMRFHPVGFDVENLEIIGSASSSIRGDSDSSDVEVESKKHNKTKSSSQTSQPSKKRKHEGGEGKVTKKSLSNPPNFISRELTCTKRKQTKTRVAVKKPAV